jgi:hypothetical protein
MSVVIIRFIANTMVLLLLATLLKGQCDFKLQLQSTKTYVYQDDEKMRVGLKVHIFIDSALINIKIEDPFKTDSIICTIKKKELCIWEDKNAFNTVIYLLEYKEIKEDTFYVHPAKLVLEKRSGYRVKFLRSDIPDQYMQAEMILLLPPKPKRKK